MALSKEENNLRCKNYYERKRQEQPLLFSAGNRWKTIMARCNNPNNHKFKRYGARGIQCLISKEEFVKWFLKESKKYGKVDSGVHVDRIDNDGHYEIGNIQLLNGRENYMKDIGEHREMRIRIAKSINSKKVKIGDKIFDSQREASFHFKKNEKYIYNRLKASGTMPDGTPIEVY